MEGRLANWQLVGMALEMGHWLDNNNEIRPE